MHPATATAVICAIFGSALVAAAVFLRSQPRFRRLIFAYVGVLLYVYGALEFFGIIRLASL
jgi:hypothetical protein